MKGGDEKEAIYDVVFFENYERRNEQKKIYIHKNNDACIGGIMFCKQTNDSKSRWYTCIVGICPI